MRQEHYCVVLGIPPAIHRQTDFVLSASLMGGAMAYPDLINVINPWIAFIAGMIGLFIGIVRVYEILSQVFTKKKQ